MIIKIPFKLLYERYFLMVKIIKNIPKEQAVKPLLNEASLHEQTGPLLFNNMDYS